MAIVSIDSAILNVFIGAGSAVIGSLVTARAKGIETGRMIQKIETLECKVKEHDVLITPIITTVAEMKAGIEYLVKRFDEKFHK